MYVRLDLRKVINSFPLSTIAKIVTSVAMAVHGLPGLNDANAYDTVLGGYVGNFWNQTGQLMEYKVGVAAGAQSATYGTGIATDNMILGLVAF